MEDDDPPFRVDSELLRYFPGHVDAFQILLNGHMALHKFDCLTD